MLLLLMLSFNVQAGFNERVIECKQIVNQLGPDYGTDFEIGLLMSLCEADPTSVMNQLRKLKK